MAFICQKTPKNYFLLQKDNKTYTCTILSFLIKFFFWVFTVIIDFA